MSAPPAEKTGRKLFDWPAWQYVGTYYRGTKPALALYSGIAAGQSLLILAILYLIRYAFDVAIPSRDVALLVWIGVGIAAVQLLNSGISLWLRAANLRIIKPAVTAMRAALVERLYDLPASWHARADQEELLVQLVQDTERVDAMSNALVSRVMPALFTSLALLVLLAVLDPMLLSVMLVISPPLFIAVRAIGLLVKRRVYIYQRAFETFGKGVSFVLHHLDLTRVQADERRELARQRRQMEQLQGAGERMAFAFALQGNATRALMGIAAVVILVVGGSSVAAGTMTVGELVAFFVAANQIFSHANVVSQALPDIITGNESLATLHRLATQTDEPPYRGTRPVDFQGRIELCGVSFDHGGGPLLQGVDLLIEPGTSTVIVGANGAGKTTLVDLILGFYRPSVGLLRADGMPYDEIDLPQLRRAIGVVRQTPHLFAATVRENITYGVPQAGDVEVARACELAVAEPMIRMLPKGLDTEIGEEGLPLSGGERQRLAVARALIRNPRLLILDEPTTHLDLASIGQLIESLRSLEQRAGILIISHDREVIRAADRVFELAEGKLHARAAPLRGGVARVARRD